MMAYVNLKQRPRQKETSSSITYASQVHLPLLTEPDLAALSRIPCLSVCLSVVLLLPPPPQNQLIAIQTTLELALADLHAEEVDRH